MDLALTAGEKVDLEKAPFTMNESQMKEVGLNDPLVQKVIAISRRWSVLVLRFLLIALGIVSLAQIYCHHDLEQGFSCRRSCLCRDLVNLLSSAKPASQLVQELPPLNQGFSHIPKYVTDYAPFVYLHDEELFWPSDMAEHLLYMTPELDYTPIKPKTADLFNLTNLDQLNFYDRGRHVFLTSNDDVEDRPDWLTSRKNIPCNSSDIGDFPPSGPSLGEFSGSKLCSQSGQSSAPAVLITVNKGNGIVDAFWFFFYSYNLGNIVFNLRWGNHVGDWEHTMIRFQDGQPKMVFFSEHNFGSAYSYDAVEKIGQRPVVYSAIGTHAMYATSGLQPYILPLGLLHDETSRGPLWDPSLNMHSYTYSPASHSLRPSQLTPKSPLSWFFFNGHWGDKSYPLDDRRQYGLIGEYHYVNGPLGPRFKNLGRQSVCEGSDTDNCVIKTKLESDGERIPHMGMGDGQGDDWSKHPESAPMAEEW